MTEMPEDIAKRKLAMLGKPPTLPLSVPARVAWGSIRIRLSRSLVTVSSVILAVAFLLVVLGESLSTTAVYRTYKRENRPLERVQALHTVLEQPRKRIGLLRLLAEQPEQARSWLASHDLSLPPAYQPRHAVALLALADWANELQPIARYKMLGNRDTADWLFALNSAESAEQAISKSRTINSRALPFGQIELANLSEKVPLVEQAVATAQTAERTRYRTVQEAGGSKAVLDVLREQGDPEAVAAMGLPLQQVLPDLDDAGMRELRAELAFEPLRDQAQTTVAKINRVFSRMAPLDILAMANENLLEEGEAYAAHLRRHLGEQQAEQAITALVENRRMKPLELALKEAETDETARKSIDVGVSPEVRALLLWKLADQLTADERQQLEAFLAEHRVLFNLRDTFLDIGFDPAGTQEKTFWLLVLSMLVCIVGIVNSMMMAVTERFLEIATMKCLGAMDSFILKAFLIESSTVGLAGSVLGAVLGVGIVLVQASARFGGTYWASFPAADLAKAAGAALVTGLILTIVGALLPAYKAARMHPIEAMRLEA
ncbi:MAG: ABC transporter permease [Planctomycetota bacterium]